MKLKIGDFARMGRLTVQTLHNDEESGLLMPGHPTSRIPTRGNGVILMKNDRSRKMVNNRKP